MIADRPYMRAPDWQGGGRSAVATLLWTLSLVYVGQLGVIYLMRGGWLIEWLQFSAHNLRSWRVWTPVTYALLHDYHSLLPLHLLFNGLAIYFFGRTVETELGPRRFWQVFGGGVLAGALAYLPLHWAGGGMIGASAGVCALITLFCVRHWFETLTVFLFFIPVRIRADYFFWIFLLIQVAGLIIGEIGSPGGGGGGVAFSAHLGGIGAGWLFNRYLEGGLSLDWLLRRRFRVVRPTRPPARAFAFPAPAQTPVRAPRVVRETAAPAAPEPSLADLRSEVDRILEKISRDGFPALSEDEKRTLDRASSLLSGRR